MVHRGTFIQCAESLLTPNKSVLLITVRKDTGEIADWRVPSTFKNYESIRQKFLMAAPGQLVEIEVCGDPSSRHFGGVTSVRFI